MSKTQLFQLAGLAGVVSGVLLILLDVAFVATFGDQWEFPGCFLGSPSPGMVGICGKGWETSKQFP
jgi:hypothetical protein